jgi:hypothetical protein
MQIDPALLGTISGLLGALIGGSASLTAAVYTQRYQDRLQRVAREAKAGDGLRRFHYERFEITSRPSSLLEPRWSHPNLA